MTAQMPMHAPAHPRYTSAPLILREPYRLLFPLGALLAWAGVLHWLAFAVGLTLEYRSIFHSLVQIEGFLACFASGFLMTFIPRRTRSPAASDIEVALAALLPICTAIFAWLEMWAVSQMFWLALLIMLAQFALRRFRRAPGSVPPSFVWVPGSLFFGLCGAVLAAVGAARGDDWMWLHDVGRGLVLQGVFTGLVLGTGTFLLPAITRGEAPRDSTPRDARDRALHLTLIAAFFGSFWLEQLVSVQAGFTLRAVTVLLALLPAKPWIPPALPGLHRRIAWLAQWMLPAGYAFVAAEPDLRRIGLHIVFIGCFAALVLAVSIHVTWSHSGRAARLHETPRSLKVMAALLAAALIARLLVDLDPTRLMMWIGVAAACFLSATIAWAVVLLHGGHKASV
jgi:uncharacterized protein involved in response to NO